jgi:hypothetical protein
LAGGEFLFGEMDEAGAEVEGAGAKGGVLGGGEEADEEFEGAFVFGIGLATGNGESQLKDAFLDEFKGGLLAGGAGVGVSAGVVEDTLERSFEINGVLDEGAGAVVVAETLEFVEGDVAVEIGINELLGSGEGMDLEPLGDLGGGGGNI